MCVSFPARVIAVDPLGATVDVEGRQRRASTLLLSDVSPGDWVLVAAGSVTAHLEPDEAQAIRLTLLEAVALEIAEAARVSGPGSHEAAGRRGPRRVLPPRSGATRARASGHERDATPQAGSRPAEPTGHCLRRLEPSGAEELIDFNHAADPATDAAISSGGG